MNRPSLLVHLQISAYIYLRKISKIASCSSLETLCVSNVTIGVTFLFSSVKVPVKVSHTSTFVCAIFSHWILNGSTATALPHNSQNTIKSLCHFMAFKIDAGSFTVVVSSTALFSLFVFLHDLFKLKLFFGLRVEWTNLQSWWKTIVVWTISCPEL